MLGPRLLTMVSAIAEQLATRPGLTVATLIGSEIDGRKLVSSLTPLDRASAEGCPPCVYTLTAIGDSM